MIPNNIVCELLGSVSFSRNQEDDVEIAEAIASQEYTTMKQVISTIEGEIRVKKYLADWKKALPGLKENPFFKPYFEKYP